MSDGEQSTSGRTARSRRPSPSSGSCLSLAHTAAFHFGDVPDPVTGQPGTANLAAAQQIIDILSLLEEKTRGNLTAEERQLLEQLALRAAHALRRGQPERRRPSPRASSSLDVADRPQAPARVLFLGTGTSHGVPMIGCTCACAARPIRATSGCGRRSTSTCPTHAKLLVDTSPDLRQQALVHELTRVDAVLFTHSHADHILGLDEIRRFNAMQGGTDPVLRERADVGDAAPDVQLHLRRRPASGRRHPELDPHEIAGPFAVRGVRVVPVPVWHGHMPVLGFRFGSFAYLTDCNRLDDSAWALVEAWTRWSSTRCATSRTPRTSAWTRRSTSSRASSRAAPSRRT